MALVLPPVFLDAADNGQPEPRFQIMVIILVISLLAVSFPGISASIPFLRIPHVVFFIGKHFGTGVILATAFIHLLQDSFEDLKKPQVGEHFHHIGKHTGLIILASLLSIFLIEYLSTSYVKYLQEESSLPPTPIPPSTQRSPRSTLKYFSSVSTLAVPGTCQPPNSTSQQAYIPHVQPYRADETTPLLQPLRTQSIHHLNSPHTPINRHPHHALLPVIDSTSMATIEVLTNSPRIITMRGCACVVGHGCACSDSAASIHSHTPLYKDATSRVPSRSSSLIEGEGLRIRNSRKEDKIQEEKPTIGRRRQVVGLLVLQLGIMIHSIVIGLTLAITTGADFTSLTTAVVFHQLFEGLSLGIRIAALPPPPPLDSKSDEESETENTSKLEAHGCYRFVKNVKRTIGGKRGEEWLKCSLAVLFAITTPTGLGLGMIAFKVRKQKQGIELARMYLIQGLMSAVSAGMLIYVSTVEMIAGDFVFGDVEGYSHHGHGHLHDVPSAEDEERASPNRTKSPRRMSTDQHPAGEANSTAELDDEHSQYHYHHRHHGKIGKKILAVLSLLAGVGGMVLVGLKE